MSRSIVSLVLSIGIVLAVPFVYVGVYFVIEGVLRSDFAALAVSSAILAPLFILLWTVVWRRQVWWTRRRTFETLYAVLMSVVIGVLVFAVLLTLRQAQRGYADHEVALVLGSGCFAGAWIILSARAWRETPTERLARLSRGTSIDIPCPKCAYNLTGLHEARCPECGTQFTLDELLAVVGERRLTDGLD